MPATRQQTRAAQLEEIDTRIQKLDLGTTGKLSISNVRNNFNKKCPQKENCIESTKK